MGDNSDSNHNNVQRELETHLVWRAHRAGAGTAVNIQETMGIQETDQGGQRMAHGSIGNDHILLIFQGDLS